MKKYVYFIYFELNGVFFHTTGNGEFKLESKITSFEQIKEIESTMEYAIAANFFFKKHVSIVNYELLRIE